VGLRVAKSFTISQKKYVGSLTTHRISSKLFANVEQILTKLEVKKFD
jgi:hypothetical protein